MTLPLPDHTPATLGDVRAVPVPTLATLLAAAETPCTSGCVKGWIDNTAPLHAWEAKHADALAAYDEERALARSARVGAEEAALTATRPAPGMRCECGGKGALLTDDGHALVAFLDRHRPQDHYHADGWA